PLSHDEVVHGKGSLFGDMPGDDWQRRANPRLLLRYQSLLADQKVLITCVGLDGDIDRRLDWRLLVDAVHADLQRWVRDLNTTYRAEPALHELDCRAEGFEWIDCHDADQSTLAFLRRGS